MSTSNATEQPAVRCFLSYARADDEHLHFASALKKSIEHFCLSNRNRRVEIFLDRASIGWGEDWRDRIMTGVKESLVFIPVVTMQYFERNSCREELLTFHDTADNLGVTELLMPLVIFGQSTINDGSSSRAVGIIERRQAIDIQDAVFEGAASPNWRRKMVEVADRLVDAIEAAEKTLGEHVRQPAKGRPEDPDQQDDTLGLQDIEKELMDSTSRLTGSFETLKSTIEQIGDLMNAAVAEIPADASNEQKKARCDQLAQDLGPVGSDFEEAATEIETIATRADVLLRSYIALVDEYGTDSMKAALQVDLKELAEGTQTFRDVETTVIHFLDQMRPVEVLNVSLRQAIRPIRAGAKAVQIATGTFGSWGKLG